MSFASAGNGMVSAKHLPVHRCSQRVLPLIRRRRLQISYRLTLVTTAGMRAFIKVITAIVLTPVILLVLGIGGCEAIKAYYDRQVERLCEKDGGAVVYEQIALEPGIRLLGGTPVVPPESARELAIPVYSRIPVRPIREGWLSISRTEYSIIRRVDGKVLGKAVFYGRAGGDFPFTVSHPTTFRCPQRTDLERKVFLVRSQSK